MEDILNNPAAQGGIIPFIAAFMTSLLLVRIWRLYGFAVLIALLSMVALTTGIQFDPLTSTRKIVLLAIFAPFVGIALEYLHPAKRIHRGVAVVFGVAAPLWLLWPYLMRQETLPMISIGGGMVVFSLWMTLGFVSLKQVSSLAGMSALSAAGFGVGGAALLGASAFLGQMGISIGVGGLAVISTLLLSHHNSNARFIELLFAGVVISLIGVAAVIYASMPWYVLIVLATIPILARIGLANDQAPWLRAVIWFGFCMVPALVAIGLSWKAAGSVPF
ncbi:MAG: hypothetical protein OEZ43_10590 [Gammaproteobacteria bacterium]|nr:hypothetical protein [Gammaproteobacteria bacterium]